MDVSNLTPEQAAALAARVTQVHNYVARDAERLDARHCKPNCPAYSAAWQCRKALEELAALLTDPKRPLSAPPKPWEDGGRGWDRR